MIATEPRPPQTLDDVPEPRRSALVAQSTLILDSYERLLNTPLMERHGDAIGDARALFEAPWAVLSHGTQPDPILNYANLTALRLWETTLDHLLAMPSRLTAEPMQRDARDKLMAQVAQTGFVTGYSGVRTSASGARFGIAGVTIWNLTAGDGSFAGQAATFNRWSKL